MQVQPIPQLSYEDFILFIDGLKNEWILSALVIL